MRDELGVLFQASNAITETQSRLTAGIARPLAQTLAASGAGTAKVLVATLRSGGLKAAAEGDDETGDIEMSFDAGNPRAKAWIEQHALDLVNDISKTTRDDIRDLLDQAFDDSNTTLDVDELTKQIAALIDDPERADLIARTETMRAANEGQLEAWDQAQEQGLLTGEELKEWITTPDDRLCPICEPLDGVQVARDETFEVDGDQLDGPPAHPRCRCTVALAV
jgi:SPP1 gp7 family putative phage head morphogenesis protein